MLDPADLQRQTLRLYGEIAARGGQQAGRLVLSCGAGASATGAPAAVSIAGGASLIVDPDTATVKAVLRSGGLDFVVNNLDEALRALKNEIRKHTPLSVALIAETAPVLAEMAERGVLPSLQMQVGAGAELLPGVLALVLQTRDGTVTPSAEAAAWLAEHGWAEQHLTAPSTAELRALDVKIMQLLATAESVRLQWLRRIPHYQRPDAASGRMVWLTAAETELLRG